MGGASGGRALTEELRSTPETLHTHDSVSRKIMGANKERIVVEHLRPRRFVIGVVQPHQGVSQEGSELAAGIFQLGASSPRLQDLRQVGLHLQLCVTVVVDAGGPFCSFGCRENWTGHLKLRKLCSQGKQGTSNLFSSGHVSQPLGQRQKRVEGDQALAIHHRANSFRNLLVNALALATRLVWTSEQLDDFVLGSVRFASCCAQYLSKGTAPGIEKLSGWVEFAEGFDNCLPQFLEL